MNKKTWGAILFTVLSLLGCLPWLLHAQSPPLTHYKGRALDLRTQQLVYTEEYQEAFDENQNLMATVIYRNPEGHTIAQKHIHFGNTPLTPKFRLEDLRDGYVEGMDWVDSRLKVIFKKDKAAALQEKILSVPPPAVADAGFHYFIQKNWKSLRQGALLEFSLIVPAEQDYFTFQIQKTQKTQWNNQDVVVLKLEIANFLLRALVDPILLIYHAQTQKLLLYEGISNINDSKGKSWIVKIEMDHLSDSGKSFN